VAASEANALLGEGERGDVRTDQEEKFGQKPTLDRLKATSPKSTKGNWRAASDRVRKMTAQQGVVKRGETWDYTERRIGGEKYSGNREDSYLTFKTLKADFLSKKIIFLPERF